MTVSLRGLAAVVAATLAVLATAPGRATAQAPTAGADTTPDWSGVERALGRSGVIQPGDVMRFSFPRLDLRVAIGDVELRPALALGSWVAFRRVGRGRTMVMGDLVLTEDEIDAVISALHRGGVEVTALHNHVLGESPRTMYLHIAAHGNEARIAATVRAALQRTKTPLDTGAAAPGPAADFELDTGAVALTLGRRGRVSGGVYQVAVPRVERVRDGPNEVPPAMGVATVINFQPVGGGRAAITGDFVMTAGEVNRVMRALRAGGIGITSLHSHMLRESPRLFFMHFWAVDDAVKLARGLRAGLDQLTVRAVAPAR